MIDIMRRGKELYKRLYPELIEKYRGKFMAIEPQSELFWIGDTLVEALQRARARFPDREFYAVEIGKEVAAEFW